MEQNAPTDEQQEIPAFYLVQLNVYLFNPGISPGLINPDFLRYNEIVDPTWQLERPVVIEPESSRIRYSNGLSLSAYDNHVVITQNAAADLERSTVTPLTSSNVICVGVAERYLQLVPTDYPYEMVSIDPLGWIDIPQETLSTLSSPLQEVAEEMRFNRVIPNVQARARYELEDKHIVLYASEVSPQVANNGLRLRFAGEVIRNVEEEDLGEQVKSIATVLGNWEQDINDFKDLATRFYSLYIRREK